MAKPPVLDGIPPLPPYDSEWSEMEKVLWMHSTVTLRIIDKFLSVGAK